MKPALLALLLSLSRPGLAQGPAELLEADPWLRPPAAQERHDPPPTDDAVWDGDWRDLRLVSTIVQTSGGVALLGTPSGELLAVQVGSHVACRYEEVHAIELSRVDLLVETDQAVHPWCVLSLELAPGPWTQPWTLHRVVACAPTAEEALERAEEPRPES